MFTLAPAPLGGPTPDEVQVPDTSVTVLIVTAGKVAYQLHSGLQRALIADIRDQRHNYKGELINTSGANIAKARNELFRRFLDETDSEWAWLIDADMDPPEDTLPRLLCSATVSGAKIVGALCCMIGSDGPIPTIYQLAAEGSGDVTRVMMDYPDNTIYQVAATGMGCLLVHRDVVQAFADANPDVRYPWVYEQEVSGHWVSEDILFTLRANSAGFPVFVDCTTPVGHVKGSATWWPSDIRIGRGFPKAKNYAVVPSINHDLTRATIRQLRGFEQVYILDNGMDGGEDFDDLFGVTRVPMPDAGIHEMWNRGVDLALAHAEQKRNVNIFILNDDLQFDERFVPRMVEALRSDKDMVAVSGNYDGRTGPSVIEVSDICAGRYDGSGGFAGFAFAVKGEWFLSGYRFPEECKWWFGDNDLVTAATLVGEGKVAIATDAHVIHLDGGGKSGGDWSHVDTAADREAFEKRWTAILQGQQEPVTVLTSIYGGYDKPVTPHPQPQVVDWIHVTDSDQPPPEPWRAIHLRRDDVSPRLAAKTAKYLPFDFADTDLVVWLDGRVIPGPGFVAWLVDELGDADMAIYRHWGRTSIAAEAEACLVENPDKYAHAPMVDFANSYLTDGYVDDRLWQSTFYVMRRNDRTIALGKRWMEEQLKWPDCLLDQIPLPPLVAECGVVVKDLPGGFWDLHGKMFVLEAHEDGT